MNTDKYCCRPIRLWSVAGRLARLYSSIDGAVYSIPAEAVNVIRSGTLDHCRALDSHVVHFVDSVVGGTAHQSEAPSLVTLAAKTRRLLEECVRAGVLISERDIRTSIEGGEDTPQDRIHCARITTFKEPEALAAGISTAVRNTRHYGRSLRFVVLDDDRQSIGEPAAIARLRHTAESLDLSYVQSDRLRDYCRALALEVGEAPEVVEFGLMPPESLRRTDGACKNALMLDGAGERYLQVDDDIQWSTGRMQTDSGAIRLYAGDEPMHTVYCRDRKEVLASTAWTTVDIVGLHEQLLAKEVRAAINCVRAPGELGELEFAGPVSQTLAPLIAGRPCTVRATFTGLGGDPATEFPSYRTMLDEAREGLVSSSSVYQERRLSREVIRAAPCVTITRPGWAMAFAMGCDATSVLPPFFPLGRSYERVFAALLARCWPEAFTACLPVFMLHAPTRSRAFSSTALTRGVTAVRLPDLVALLIEHSTAEIAGDPTSRLSTVARHFVEVGSLNESDFSEVVAVALFRQRSKQLGRYYRQLAKYKGQPVWWANDVRDQIIALERSLEEGWPATLHDYPALSRSDVKTTIAMFGRFLRVWTELTRGAARLKLRERSLSDRPAAAVGTRG